ncbi:hypothetical protein, partial [Intestinimonas butyriciproducens]|uniref:hypothetical protein n=1 Tax=Intestinimonas butyriciproducens TaxID=1297617 RepID=UPI001AB03384
RKNPEAASRRCKGGGALTAAILKHKESYRKERSFYEFRTESLQLVFIQRPVPCAAGNRGDWTVPRI